MYGYRLGYRASQGTLLNYFDNIKSVIGVENIISHYNCDEESGSLIDVISDNNVVVGNLTYQNQGYLKKSVKFSTSSYGNIAPVMADMDVDEGSIMMWIKTTKEIWVAGSAITFFRVRWSGVVDDLYFYKTGSSVAEVVSSYKRNNTTKTVYLGCPDTTDWIHFCVSWSKSNDRFDSYINGVKFHDLQGQTSIGDHSGAALRTDLCGLGSGRSASAEISYDGYMDEITFIHKELTEVDLQKILNYGQIVFDGDSRSSVKPWTTAAIEGLKASPRNTAVSGATVQNIIDSAATNVDAKYRINKKNCVVIWAGVNSSALTANQIFDQLKSYCLARKLAGYKVLICTEIDAQDATRLSNSWPTKYLTLNTLIKADTSFYDGIADLGAASELQNALDTTFYLADKVHLTLAGYRIVGGIVNTALKSVY